MRPLINSLLGLGLVSATWCSASANPPAAVDRLIPNLEFTPAVVESLPPSTTLAQFGIQGPTVQKLPGEGLPEGFFVDTRLSKAAYLKLAGEYADFLTDEELDAEIAVLEKNLHLKRSEAHLKSVRQALEEIIERFPSTPAATQALRMLEQLNPPTPETSPPSTEAISPAPKSLPRSTTPVQFRTQGQQGMSGQQGSFGVPPIETRFSKVAYLNLVSEYADFLTDEQIDAELADFEKILNTKRSEAHLKSVRYLLEEVIEQFPSTPAAAKATRMLEQLNTPAPEPTLPSNK